MTTAVKAMSLDEIRKEIGEITPKLQKAYDEAGYTPGGSLDLSKVTVFGEGDDRFKSTQMSAMNVRLEELGRERKSREQIEDERKAVEEAQDWLSRPAGHAPTPSDGPSGKLYTPIVDLLAKSTDWISGARIGKTGPALAIDVDVKAFLDREIKTVMSTGAGFAPQAIRSGDVVRAAFQQPAVIDLIPIVRTNQNAYVFMRQTTRTNNAAEIAESTNGSLQSLAESAFVWTEISETIRKIGHFIPVTDEQLEDIEGILDLINADMLLGVRQRLSSQILNGDGNAPNIEGLLDSGRDTTDVDGAGMFIADIVDKLIEECAVTGFVNADAIVMHNRDWHGYRRATTTDGIYIAGSPSENGPRMMWGLPVVTTTEIAQGTALAGDFGGYARLAVKRGVEVQISSEHASYFIQGVKAIKAEMRATLAVRRETAFAKSDDIVVS